MFGEKKKKTYISNLLLLLLSFLARGVVDGLGMLASQEIEGEKLCWFPPSSANLISPTHRYFLTSHVMEAKRWNNSEYCNWA